MTDIPRAMVDIVNAIIVLMVSAQFVITLVKKRSPNKQEATHDSNIVANKPNGAAEE